MTPYYQRGPVTIYHADCLDVLPTLEAGSVDAVVTDPPYGLGNKWNGGCWKTVSGRLWDGEVPEWDRTTATAAVEAAIAVGIEHVIWGGNYYALPPVNSWLVWDKMQEHSGSECELAWTDLKQPVRCFRMSRVEAYCGKELKEHPNQKPLPLIAWTIEFLEGRSILDPFLGSGTTAVACIHTGRKCIGIEIEEKYCEIAAKRCDREISQGRLFQPTQEPTETQTSLAFGAEPAP